MITELHSLMVQALRDGVDVDSLLALAREQLELDQRVEALTGSVATTKLTPSRKVSQSVDWVALLETAPKWEGGKSLFEVANLLTDGQYPEGTPGNKFIQLSRKLGGREGYRKDGSLWHCE